MQLSVPARQIRPNKVVQGRGKGITADWSDLYQNILPDRLVLKISCYTLENHVMIMVEVEGFQKLKN